MFNNTLINKSKRVIPLLLVFTFLLLPAASSAGSPVPGQTGAYITPAALNVTNGTIPDPSVLQKYQETIEPVRVRAELNETSLPGPKGEMASGPRTIGFAVDPVMTLGILLVIAVIGTGIMYYLKRVRRNNDQE